MAHQVSPPGTGSPSMQPVHAAVIPNASQAPLDLNLSQRASQNPLKGQDEPEVSHQKASEASPSPHQENVPKVSTNTITSNGSLDSLSKSVSEHRGDQQSPITPQKPNADPAVEAATNAHNEPLQSGTTVFEAGPPVVNGPAPTPSARKRKSPRVKKPPPDTNKKIILALEANEDEVLARLPKGKPQAIHLPKNKLLDTHVSISKAPLDIAERRLLLDERKMRLAEQRFALEEKKLEATIEIGKGLIISMERMTNTISTLGVSSTRPHR